MEAAEIKEEDRLPSILFFDDISTCQQVADSIQRFRKPFINGEHSAAVFEATVTEEADIRKQMFILLSAQACKSPKDGR